MIDNNNHLTDVKLSEIITNEKLLNALHKNGFEYTTPIQNLSLPESLIGKDIIAQSQTGTGKTLAFLVCIFNKFLQSNFTTIKTGPRAVILAPTRELTQQISLEFSKIANYLGFKVVTLIGGEKSETQIEKLHKGFDVIVATPGRIIDFYKRGLFDFNDVETVILDEADKMMSYNFLKDLRYLLKRFPDISKRQTLLFSATISPSIRELAYDFMNDPVEIETSEANRIKDQISEEIFYVANEDKLALLLTLIEEEWPDKCIVFTNTKFASEAVHQCLEADGHRVALFNSDVSQSQRNKLLASFVAGNIDILVCTDVAARGLHIPNVTHVFNFDLPDDPENYVHRIGRTGRANDKGISISFCCESFSENILKIEELIGKKIKVSKYDKNSLLDLPKSSKSNYNDQPKKRLYKKNNKYNKK